MRYGQEKCMISVPCYFFFPVQHAHSNIYVIIVVKNYDYIYFQFLNMTLINKDHILMKYKFLDKNFEYSNPLTSIYLIVLKLV